MEDSQIVELYWQRDEQAIGETSRKYVRYCYTIAYNILSSKEDADESVNDTYMTAWERIPPYRPAVLSAFLGKLTRRISLNLRRYRTREKRGGGEVPLALEELAECIPAGHDVEEAVEEQVLAAAISRFLAALPETERDVFVCRYWFLTPVAELARRFGFSESKTKSMLFRTREKLKKELGKEGLL